VLNGLTQPFQQAEQVIGFFNAYGEGQQAFLTATTTSSFRKVSRNFQATTFRLRRSNITAR
jgi:hypothetical protein